MESRARVRVEGTMLGTTNGKIPELLALYDEVAKCGRCGFCQPTCPVYTATNKEPHVARGKNVLFRNLIEGQTSFDPDLRDAFENCLLCRACTANCSPQSRPTSWSSPSGRPTPDALGDLPCSA